MAPELDGPHERLAENRPEARKPATKSFPTDDAIILKPLGIMCWLWRSVRMIFMYEVAIALGLLSAGIIILAHALEAYRAR